MMVMMTANTPSLNASNRPLPTRPSYIYNSTAPEPMRDELRRVYCIQLRPGLLLVFLDLFELRVHYVVLLAAGIAALGLLTLGRARLVLGGIKALGHLAGD